MPQPLIPRLAPTGTLSWVAPPAGWRGVAASRQAECDACVPALLSQEARVRVLHLTPRERIRLPVAPAGMANGGLYIGYPHRMYGTGGVGVSWLIVSGQTGPDARPLHPSWVRELRDAAVSAGVPFFFAGWGEWLPVLQPTDADEVVAAGNTYPHGRWLEPDGSATHRTWDCVMVDRVGAARSGRLLDGREWVQMPEEVT